jgi:hypothetical protein
MRTTIEQRGLEPVRSVLENGARVIAKRATATPAVTIHASFEAGTIFDPPAEPGVSHFVSRTIDRGTPTHTADEIAEALENRGISLAITVNRHALSLVCTCLVEDLESTLETVAGVVMLPAFPDPEVETRRGEIVTMIRQDEDNPAAVASEALLSLLYGDLHPYGRSKVSNESRGRRCRPFIRPGFDREGCRWSWSATWSRPAQSTPRHTCLLRGRGRHPPLLPFPPCPPYASAALVSFR